MKPAWRGAFLVYVLVAALAAIAPTVISGRQVPANAPTSASSRRLLQYALPPDKLQKSYALYRLDFTLYFATTLWSLVVLLLMLRSRFGGRLRDWAERVSRYRILQAVIVMSLFVLILELTQLPFAAYAHSVGLQYGLSVQTWVSWFGDWGKGLLLEVLFASIAGWILYAVLRRSPQRWWFYFWLAMVPILVLVMFIAPIWIEPLFNRFEPLTGHHADLVAQIERVVHRGGMNIPEQRMFEMKASEKTNELNAYVTGFGRTKRVVVWDTTMEHMTIPQTLFVFGHEMGHYVLGHIPKELTLILIQLLVLMYVGCRLANWAVTRYGSRWGIRSLSDRASLPLLVLILSVLAFLDTPIVNGISRHYEHQADQYGLEVIHGLVPDAHLAAAQAFQILGERSLDYPYVGKLAEFWSWSHPTIRDRMIFVQSYDPWGEGWQPEFVKNAP
ncbi:MAG: M48 family metallopeptidase [Acidobacteriota bacterium]|nr:M48 family metallopeptidase [Acidobacteriota bacterium]